MLSKEVLPNRKMPINDGEMKMPHEEHVYTFRQAVSSVDASENENTFRSSMFGLAMTRQITANP
jgi:hypothetical protein